MKPYYSFAEINAAVKSDAEDFVKSCCKEYNDKELMNDVSEESER